MNTLARLGIQKVEIAERLFRLNREQLFSHVGNPRSAVQLTINNQRWQEVYEHFTNPHDTTILLAQQNLSQLFYAGGRTDLSVPNQKAHLKRGRWSMEVALEMGSAEAGIYMARQQLNDPSAVPSLTSRESADSIGSPVSFPPRVLSFITQSASTRRDWRTMTLYLDYQLRRPQTAAVMQANFEMATALLASVEASTVAVAQQPPSERFEQPWFLLCKAADAYYSTLQPGSVPAIAVQDTYIKALKAGRNEYNDTRANRMLVRTTVEVKSGSERWIELLTQSAMQGREESCFLLGYHYLNEEGWLQGSGQHPSSRTGLWWIEASAVAAARFTEVISRRYLLLAVLMRENGFEQEARPYLQRGVDALKEVPSSDSLEYQQWLQGYLDRWERDDTTLAEIFQIEQHLLALYQAGTSRRNTH